MRLSLSTPMIGSSCVLTITFLLLFFFSWPGAEKECKYGTRSMGEEMRAAFSCSLVEIKPALFFLPSFLSSPLLYSPSFLLPRCRPLLFFSLSLFYVPPPYFLTIFVSASHFISHILGFSVSSSLKYSKSILRNRAFLLICSK